MNIYLFAASQGLAAWFHNCNRDAASKDFKLRPEQRLLYAQTVGYPHSWEETNEGKYERDGHRCQCTYRFLHPDEGSLAHVEPRSRVGRDGLDRLAWSAKDVSVRKAGSSPHEAGLRLLRYLPQAALV